MIPITDEIIGGIPTDFIDDLWRGDFCIDCRCANVANLLLARSSVRFKGIHHRSAIGAARRQIIRQC